VRSASHGNFVVEPVKLSRARIPAASSDHSPDLRRHGHVRCYVADAPSNARPYNQISAALVEVDNRAPCAAAPLRRGNYTVAVFHAPAPIPLVRGRVGRNLGMYLHLPL
jgi:hypothetical protein